MVYNIIVVMRYILFFSYQSDTKHEFNFIKNILESEVKNALLVNDIDLTVDFGMRDVAGNPDLLQTMLIKGKECDIFLADLTYVAEFTNSNGNPKFVPNPNVMLELGHAWNEHGDNHTIFIQNKAKGQAEHLPVDLKGFRFPISYELNDDASKSEKTTVKSELAKDLIKTITTVVNSIESSNKTRFLPFEKFAHCSLQKIHNQYEFIRTGYFDKINNDLNAKLSSSQAVVLSGKSGCGKSRIVKEFVCRDFSEQQQNDIFYCKLSQTSPSVLFDMLKKLKIKLKRDSYFIIDNCDDITANEFPDILYGTNHKVIAIIGKSANKEQIKIDAKMYINEIIGIKAPNKWNEVMQQNITDIGHIVAILHNDSYQPNTYNVDSDSEMLLGYISLFSKIGFTGQFENEFSKLCILFKWKIDNKRNIVKKLIEDGYIVYQGGFIFIESDAVANEYAKKMWEQGLDNVLSFDALIGKANLAKWFINRQIYIVSHCKQCSEFLKSIVKTNLRDVTFVDSQLGKSIISNLAEVFPKETLISLEILSNDNMGYEFGEIHGPLWAINKIIANKGLFNRAIQLLLKLRDRNTYYKTDFKKIAADYFGRINYNFNPNVSVEAFEAMHNSGHIDIVKNVYTSIFNVGYKDLGETQTRYLREMFLFLISIRKENKEWVNSVIIENILASRHLGISRKVFAEVRKIVEENDFEDVNIAEILSNKIRWASPDEKKSIKALLKSMSDKDSRMMLYNAVVLNKSDNMPDRELLKSSMSEIASGIIQNENWEDDIDILLRGARKWDANCFWFGYAISQQYEECDNLITRCLESYKNIPLDEQSYGFFTGLFHKYVSGEDMSVFKQNRDELLKKPEYFNLAMSLSNACINSIEDLTSIKDAIIANSLSLIRLNELYNINLSESEYCSFASELIQISKDGADSAIKLLDRTIKIYPNINISICIDEILERYDYWDASDYSYDSVYSMFIELLEYTLKNYPSGTFAEKVIESIIKGCGNRHFNNNYSVLDLFRILIEQYQELFLDKILHIINDDSFETYRKRDSLVGLFEFQHTANLDIYLQWCNKNGKRAAEFVAKFIAPFKDADDGNLQWTDEVKSLMYTFSDDTYVLSNISTRLFNGEVSISKYTRLKNAYDLLIDDNNATIRLWAIEHSESMERYIQSKQKEAEVRNVWYR